MSDIEPMVTDSMHADGTVKPLISVIMPIYNVEDYLAWSAKSVLEQSYPHFELICVDDGSTDASGMLVDALAESDARVIAIHQQNRGLSGARNTGICHASGDIVIFLDSDDALRDGALETIATIYENTCFDVLTYGANPFPSSEASIWLKEVLSPRHVEYDAFHSDILFKERSHPFAWRTACKRTFLNAHDITFDETIGFGEDQVFHFQIYPLSSKTVFIPDKLVDYRVQRADSLMATRFSDLHKRAYEHIELIDKILAGWEKMGLLDRWGLPLFAWTVDFMIPSFMLNKDREDYDDIRARLAFTWQAHFDDAFLRTCCANRTFGALVDWVLNGVQHPSHMKMMRILFSMRRRAYGLAYALRQAAEQPLKRLRGHKT